MDAFSGLKIIELAQGIAGPFCGKLFAGLGADVVKIEPPAGDTSRTFGPFIPDIENKTEGSGAFLYLNTGKRSVTIDLESENGKNEVLGLIKEADILIDDLSAKYKKKNNLDFSDLSVSNPDLIQASVTPFGQYGPYSDYLSTDMIINAVSGELYIAGQPEREPLKKGGSLGAYHGGMHAFIGAVSSLMTRNRDGSGQSIDVSLMEASASVIGLPIQRWAYMQTIAKRIGPNGNVWPTGIWPTEDGYVLAHTRPQIDWWASFCIGAKDQPEFQNPKYSSDEGRAENIDELDGLFQAWLFDHKKEDIYYLMQEQGLPFGYVANARDLLKSPQLKDRKYFVDINHPETGELPYPGAPFAMSKTPFNFKRAPLLGEHNEEILASTNKTKQPKLDKHIVKESQSPSGNGAPLKGIRVIDFSHIWAGPFCARILGDLGAEVIKIESITRYDPERGPAVVDDTTNRWRVYPDGKPTESPYNRAGRFNAYNKNKLSLTLDLRTEEGKAKIKELISISDVIVENFSTGVMDRLGIGYDDCLKLRPDIIFMSLSGFGRTGPESGFAAFGLTQEAMSGLSSITGYPDEIPIDTGVFYGDPTGGVCGAAAVLSALWHRQRHGDAQFIDMSQREAFISILPELVFNLTMQDRILESTGNRDLNMAPHGCYPCEGDDSWVVITIQNDDQFETLCSVMGNPKLAQDARFNNIENRLLNQDQLDEIICTWTGDQKHVEVMNLLQKNLVPAAAAFKNFELLEDPHMIARDFFETVTHPDAGTHKYIGMPWKFSNTPVSSQYSAPNLGQHNREILEDLMGLTESEYSLFTQNNIIGTVPIN